MDRREFNQAGRNLLNEFEGNSLTAYQDQGGVWTIGRGSTRGVISGMVISETESDSRFDTDIAIACVSADRALGPIELNSNQYSAFVCFAFNVKGFATLPLTNRVRALDFEGAKNHWLLYDKVRINGILQSVGGLSRRRKAELDLFLTPV